MAIFHVLKGSWENNKKKIVSGYEQGCTLDCTYTVVDVGA